VKRRALLAATGSGLAAALAGCVETSPTPGDAGPPPGRDAPAAGRTDTTTTFDGTPPEVLSRRELPEPPATATPESASEFVRAYERAVLHNDLVEYAAGRGQPVRTEVSAVRTDVLLSVGGESGALLVASDGSATARRTDGGYTRNRALVVHYVADGAHHARPYNAYRCARHGVPAEAVEDGAEPAKLQLYDFSDGEGARVSVAVDDRATGERAFFDRYDFGELGLVVQPGVAAEAGRFDVSVATQSGGVDSLTWNPEPGTPSWWGLTAVVLPDGGGVAAGVLDPAVPASFRSDLCRRPDS